MTTMQLLMWVLLEGAVVVLASKLVPGISVKSWGTALVVAGVYGTISYFLRSLLIFLSLPLILLTFGLGLLVVNGFLLWLTDKLVPGFEIKGFGPLAVGTLVISVGGIVVNWIVR